MWGPEQQHAFERLKAKVSEAPVLAIFDADPTTVHEVHTDASLKAIGTILLLKCQEDKHFHPVAFFSRKLNSA